MEPAEERKIFIDRKFNELTKAWFLHYVFWGALLFFILGFLDYVGTPKNLTTALVFRLSVALFLFMIYFISRKTENIKILYFFAFSAIVMSTIAIELLIFNLRGDRSQYYAGLILLNVIVLTFIPARMWFSIAASCSIYIIYLVSVGLSEQTTESQAFLAYNVVLFAILASALLMRYFNNKGIIKEFGLSYDLDVYRNNLERLVEERTRHLSDVLQQVEKVADEWRTTFDASSDIIILLDKNMNVVKSNRMATVFLEKDYRELIGKPACELFRCTESEEEVNPLHTLQETKKHVEQELFLSHMGVWIWVTTDPILNEHNDIDGAVMTVRNITEIKKLQESIAQGKVEWEETFNTLTEAVTIHDNDFNIIRANSAAQELLNIPALTTNQAKCYQSFHGSECPPDGCPSCVALKTGEPAISEVFEPHLNKHLEIKALPRLDGERNIIGLVHIARDITDKKKSEEEIRNAHAVTNIILEKAPYGIYVIGKKGNVEYANPAKLDISGSSHEQFLGTNVLDLPSYKELGITDKISSALEGTPFFFGPVKYVSHYGKKETIRNFIGIPLQNMERVIIFVEDITDLRRAEEERQEFQVQLLQAQRMDSIGRLAGGIAHDFNNILSSVLGYSERALRRLPDDDPIREDIEVVSEAGEKAVALTRQLLAFSRRQKLETEAININSVIENISKILERVIGQNIEIQLYIDTPVKNIIADKSQVEQVFMNLIVNARDSMPNGGKLIISTADTKIDEAFVAMNKGAKPGDYVVLKVMDTGEGMADEVKAKIFEPFYTTKEMGKGTGLGLATVYGIVKQHNGYIAVNSVSGEGTVFDVYFPTPDREIEESIDKKPQTDLRGTETVLIVDDEPSIRMLLASSLRPLGYKVLEASNGEEALMISDSFEGAINLLLSDVDMPHMNGNELAAALGEKRPDIKVIFISGQGEGGSDQNVAPGAPSHFIHKPFTSSTVAHTVRELLDTDHDR